MQSPKILIVIPAYNEVSTIARLIQEIKKQHPQISTLVINDGSSDGTGQEARRAGSLVVNHPYNLGIGGAVQTGFKVAARENYDIVIQIDGDSQHDPVYLNDLLHPILTNQSDFVIGSRFIGEHTGFQSTFGRRIGIRFFVFLLNILTGIRLTDPTSGFRAVNRKLICFFAEYYPIDYPEPEAIKMAKRFGARIAEVPVKMRKRLGGISSIRYFKTIYYMIKVTFAILIDTLKQNPYKGAPHAR